MQSSLLNEAFLSKGLTELYRNHGRIISIYDGNPDDGSHFDLANVCDEAIDNYKPYNGNLEGYKQPVMITFDDGYTIVIEGENVNPEGWQTKTRERHGNGTMYRKSINESAVVIARKPETSRTPDEKPARKKRIILVKKRQ